MMTYVVYLFGGVGTYNNALQVANMTIIDTNGFTLVNTNASTGHELYPACTADRVSNLIYVFGGASSSKYCTSNLKKNYFLLIFIALILVRMSLWYTMYPQAHGMLWMWQSILLNLLLVRVPLWKLSTIRIPFNF